MKKEKVFIGIDVSKLTLDICIVKNTTTSLVIKNNKTDIKKFLNEVTKGSSEVYLCIENTGKYGWLITELAPDYLTNFYIINPLHLKRSMGLIRGKNDKIDAVRIAQFIKRNYQEEVCYVRERSLITALKVLVSERGYKVKSKTQLKVKNKDIEVISDKKLAKKLIKSNLKLIVTLEQQIKEIELEIKRLIESDKQLKQHSYLLKSIPGVGDILSTSLIIKTNEFKSITDPRKLACYCGVVPFENRSGTSIFGKKRLSLLADKKIKKVLHLGAMRAIQMENDFRVYYIRKVKEGKNKMSVVNAIRNKIIHTAYALIKNQELFQNRLVLS